MIRSFPTLDTYISRLPHGLTSYPEVTAKATILRSILADAPESLAVDMGLPPRLEALVAVPPPPNTWTLEAELWSAAIAVFDLSFRDHGGIPAYTDWSRKMNLRMMKSSLYRVLFSVMSPERIFVGAAQRFAAFHRGLKVSDIVATRSQRTFNVTAPPYLLPEIGHIGLCSGIWAALEVAGAKDVTVTGEIESPTSIAFTASWR